MSPATAGKIMDGTASGVDLAVTTTAYLQSTREPGRTVFDARLGLTVLDLATSRDVLQTP